MHHIPRDRVNKAELRTDLHFAETSSRPIKAALNAVKIDIFSQQNLPEERGINQTCFSKSLLKLKVNENRHKFLKIGLILNECQVDEDSS